VSKKKVSMTIDEGVYEEFRKFCEANGMKISTRVEAMMKESMKNVSLSKFMKK
jgi:antitoxin component of RelBE/YafQ-DinJ toxin-antitoxin module